MAETDQAQPQPVQQSPGMDQKQERTWALFAHLGGLLGFIPPLVIWLVKKDESPLIDDNGKEALNFQITIAIAYLVAFVLVFVLIGFFIMMALNVFNIVMVIIAAIKANEGQKYRYPVCIRFIK